MFVSKKSLRSFCYRHCLWNRGAKTKADAKQMVYQRVRSFGKFVYDDPGASFFLL